MDGGYTGKKINFVKKFLNSPIIGSIQEKIINYMFSSKNAKLYIVKLHPYERLSQRAGGYLIGFYSFHPCEKSRWFLIYSST